MKSAVVSIALLSLLVTASCLVSTQEGERTHVNSKPPEEITFHFATSFNKALVVGRSLALLLIPGWLFLRRAGGGTGPSILIGVAALAASGWLAVTGFSKMNGYRVEIDNEELHWTIPGKPDLRVSWDDIDSIEVEGMARDVSLGAPAKSASLKWSPEWEDLLIHRRDGAILDGDLRPLSMEQRGNLWRAIVRKAGLTGEVQILPTGSR